MIGKVVRRESGSVASDYMVVTRMSQMALRKMDITTTAVFSHARKQQTANGELLKRFSFDDWYWRSLILLNQAPTFHTSLSVCGLDEYAR